MSASTFGSRGRATWVAPHADLLAAALATLRVMIEDARWTVWRWYQLRGSCRQVAGLSDHLLRDIGLSRSEVLPAAIRCVHEAELRRRGAIS